MFAGILRKLSDQHFGSTSMAAPPLLDMSLRLTTRYKTAKVS